MQVVGLVSGGKDSCYNLMKCKEDGHEIVCLANLVPPSGTQEMDSYMYQTVGSDAIELYSSACNVPLYRQTITGQPLNTAMEYIVDDKDEVEDLTVLLKKVIKEHPGVKGVSVGAIFSSYQKVRVESVCQRLGLTPLCYLWEREQECLLDEMINAGVVAILVKVAAMGLTPKKHLGKTLQEVRGDLHTLNSKYGINVCGEGGEYETLVLDCPLFSKRLEIVKASTVIHSDDTFAPVGYLVVEECKLSKYGINVCGEGGEYETLVLDCPLFSKRLEIVKASTVIHSDDTFAPVGYLVVEECKLVEK